MSGDFEIITPEDPSDQPAELARDAIQETLRVVRMNPTAARVLGPSTAAWQKLTAAQAALTEDDVEDIRARYRPVNL